MGQVTKVQSDSRDDLPSEGFSREVCKAYEAWRYEDLPDEVVQSVKSFILDTVGAIGGAANAPGLDILKNRFSKWETGGPSTSLLGKWKASPPTAALLNGAAAHAIEFDDFHDFARVHAYCVILPAVLAAAEGRGGVSGRDFITAVATGIEFHARMGLTCYDSLGSGWHPTVALGGMAAAMAAGRVLDLKGEQLVHALGIAYHQTSGTRQALADGVLIKRVGPGLAARAGVLSAFLASDGLTGPVRCLEGEAGYFRLYEREQVKPEFLIDGIGENWEVINYSMKPYPCCRCTHNLIAMGSELHHQGIKADDIEKADLFLGRTNWKVVGQTPYDVTKDSIVQAQFSAPYCFARSIVDGKVDLSSFTRPQITQVDVAKLAERVNVIEDDAIAPTATEPARMSVLLKNGRVINKDMQTMKGSPSNPMTESEILEKFKDCMAFGFDAPMEKFERLAEIILDFENLSDSSMLSEIFPEARM